MSSEFNLRRRHLIKAAAVMAAAPSLLTTAIARSADIPTKTGYATVPHGRIWWMQVGSGKGTPLLLLHGGPGGGHYNLLPLKALADERPVIFFDQLGCGQSDSPQDPSIYTMQGCVEQVDAIRHTLGLEQIILFGHSFGSSLAIEYLCQGRGHGVSKLILAGAVSSMPQFEAGANRLLAQLPNHEGERIAALDAAGKNDTPEYQALAEHFYDLHVCRKKPLPPEVVKTYDTLSKAIVYRVMNGPNEFTVRGNLKSWDRSGDLASIQLPTLLTTGQYDEVTLDCHQTIQRAIRGSQLKIFADCSHLTMNEKPREYVQALREFMA